MPSDIQFWIDRLDSLVDGEQASMRLVALGAAAIAPLKQFLLSGAPRGIFQPRQWVVEALGALGAKDVLMEYLARDDQIRDPVVQQGEDAVRNTAARLIARWKTDDAVFEMLMALANKRLLPGVVFALGEFGRPEALPCLELALEDDVARPAAEQAFSKFGEMATDALVFSAVRKWMNEDEEVPSSLMRRRSAAKILSDTKWGTPCWPKLRFLLDDGDPELVVHAAKLAVVGGSEFDKRHTVLALLRILPDAPWYVREDAASCLEALYDLGAMFIEREIARRLALPPHERARDSALLILVRLQTHKGTHA